MSSSQKVALITGSARRIGKSIALHLHTAGYHVLLHYFQSGTQARRLQQLLDKKRSGSSDSICQDLLQTDAARILIDYVIERYGRLDVLVNNASIFYKSSLRPEQDLLAQDMFTCNVLVPYHLSLYARPLLAKSNGNIINITDIHGSKALKEYSVYCQSKAALIMQTQSLAREFAPEIRVNAIAPGAIAWPEGENLLEESQKQRIINKTPLQQHGDPEYIAQAALALIENPFITGQNVAVDGGRLLV